MATITEMGTTITTAIRMPMMMYQFKLDTILELSEEENNTLIGQVLAATTAMDKGEMVDGVLRVSGILTLEVEECIDGSVSAVIQKLQSVGEVKALSLLNLDGGGAVIHVKDHHNCTMSGYSYTLDYSGRSSCRFTIRFKFTDSTARFVDPA